MWVCRKLEYKVVRREGRKSESVVSGRGGKGEKKKREVKRQEVVVVIERVR
jgi:hypothetical protein